MNVSSFAALAEPNRLRIVELLRNESLSVNNIATSLEIRQPQASKHLSVLSDAGFVTVRPVAQRRMYGLNQEAFSELERWADSFQKHWDQKLDSLEAYLKNG